MTGHDDDCAACRWHQLPDEDQAVLDERAFLVHTRQEPPGRPPEMPQRAKEGVAVGATVSVLLLAVGWQAWPFWIIGGLAAFGTLVYLGGLRSTERSYEDTWRSQMKAWKADQSQAWMQARARGELWPCPTCGDLACSSQHAVTTTRGTRLGPFYTAESRTDPL